MIEQTPQETAAPQATPTVDDFQALLSEFDAATRPAQETSAPSEPEETKPSVAASVDQALAKGTEELSLMSVKNSLNQVNGLVQHLYAHQVREQDFRDFDRVVESGNKMLKDAGVPVSEEYVRRWFTSEAMLNDRLRTAFDSRNESDQHLRAYKRLEKKALHSLLSAAEREPDPQATSDKAAVTWAMRNPTRVAPPDRPVRYGDLTDAEFASEKKKLGIG